MTWSRNFAFLLIHRDSKRDESIIHFYCHRWSYQRFTHIHPYMYALVTFDLASSIQKWVYGEWIMELIAWNSFANFIFLKGRWFYYLSVQCHKSPFCVCFLWHLMMRKCFIFAYHRFKIKLLQIIRGTVNVSFSTMFTSIFFFHRKLNSHSASIFTLLCDTTQDDKIAEIYFN